MSQTLFTRRSPRTTLEKVLGAGTASLSGLSGWAAIQSLIWVA